MLKIPAEIYCRCCGYYRPVEQYNPAKKEEFRLRKNFKLKEEVQNEKDI
jgi:hypothetical protein